MRRFLINILIFSAIVIVLAAVGEIVVRNLPSSYATKDAALRSRGDRVATLILGTSHTYYGLNPDEMGDSVFNLANVSQTPEYDLALLRRYAPYMPSLRRIIMPVSYFTYRDPILEEGPESNLAVRYKTRMHLPLHSDLSLYNLELSDFDGFTGRLANLVLRQPYNRCSPSGFGLGYDLSARAAGWMEQGSEHAARHTLSNPGRPAQVLETQREILREARDRGIEVVLVTTPAHRSYTDRLDPAQEAEMRANIDSLVAEFGVACHDFLRDPRFTDADFYDPDHLNTDGARRLSRLMTALAK